MSGQQEIEDKSRNPRTSTPEQYVEESFLNLTVSSRQILRLFNQQDVVGIDRLMRPQAPRQIAKAVAEKSRVRRRVHDAHPRLGQLDFTEQPQIQEPVRQHLRSAVDVVS